MHFAWDSTLPTWLGIMRRDGDGSDLRWFKGPERCATHTMGCFSDGERVYIDMDMGAKNQFPFFPNKDGSPFDAVAAQGRITRLSVDLAQASRARLRDGSALSAHRRACRARTIAITRCPIRSASCPASMPRSRSIRAWRGAPLRPLNTWTRFDHAARQDAELLRRAGRRACRNAASCRARRARPRATAI